jgi:hypothetical protein
MAGAAGLARVAPLADGTRDFGPVRVPLGAFLGGSGGKSAFCGADWAVAGCLGVGGIELGTGFDGFTVGV